MKHLKNFNWSDIYKKLSAGKYTLVALIAILATAAYLRLWRIREYMTFLGDEGRDVLVVKRMIVDFDIPFLGPTASVGGFFLGPMYYYFMAPFLALFALDPVGPAVMVALFGIATVYLVYKVGSEFYSKTAGIIAAALYTVSPLVIAHSRSSWNPNIVPFFSLLYIYSLRKAVVTHSKWWYFIVGSCIGIGVQLHYLYLFLVPVAVLYILLYDLGLKRVREYAFSVFGALFFFAPFLAFEVKNGFLNIRTIFSYVTQDDEVSYTSASGLETVQMLIFRLFGRLVFFFPQQNQIEHMDPSYISRLSTIVWIAVIVSLVYLTISIIRYRDKKDVLILLWLFFGIGLFVFYQREIFDYYLVIVFALPFLLMGRVFSLLVLNKKFRYVGIAFVAALLFFNWQGRPFVHTPNKQLDQMETTARVVFEHADGEPFNFALITLGNSDHAYRYFFEIWDNHPVVIENFENDPERETVTDQLFVICEYKDCEPVGHSLWEIAGFGQAEIAGSWELPTAMVYKLVAYEGEMVQ